jgi:hypothetical protein
LGIARGMATGPAVLGTGGPGGAPFMGIGRGVAAGPGLWGRLWAVWAVTGPSETQ